MCLAVPGQLTAIEGATGTVEVSGTTVQVRLDLLPEAREGDFVLVHAGFALTLIDQQEAADTLAVLREVRDRVRAGD
ncbi:HypC/HybG/HupF family hydrogenase formation chaperone [bacterium]|nr:HypC/HybG/HupF family hydrogenase formation chaperone [bacterium]